jgi:hypothetical protein
VGDCLSGEPEEVSHNLQHIVELFAEHHVVSSDLMLLWIAVDCLRCRREGTLPAVDPLGTSCRNGTHSRSSRAPPASSTRFHQPWASLLFCSVEPGRRSCVNVGQRDHQRIAFLLSLSLGASQIGGSISQTEVFNAFIIRAMLCFLGRS